LNRDRRLLHVFLVAALLVIGWIALTPVALAGLRAERTNTAEASTPYGESISIKIGSGTQTSGTASLVEVTVGSWVASYSDGDSQNVYTVNGTYKSQELVTLSYSLSVTHSNVQSIQATVKVKAIDVGDSSSYEYTLANQKSLSGASPISDNGQTQKSISAHLTDAGASTSGATIRYQIYCQVTAQGTVSGETLTATVPYTSFGKLVYAQSSESSSAEVTPQVSVAAWAENRVGDVRWAASVIDESLGLPGGTAVTAVAVLCVAAAAVTVVKRR